MNEYEMYGYRNFEEAKKALLNNNTQEIVFYELPNETLHCFFIGKKIILGTYFRPDSEDGTFGYCLCDKKLMELVGKHAIGVHNKKGKDKCRRFIKENLLGGV